MDTASSKLVASIDELIFWLKENKKIISGQKYWLNLIMNKIINSEHVSGKETELFKVFRDLDKPNSGTMPVFNKLNHNFNFLIKWLNEYQGYVLTNAEKRRIKNIQQMINDKEEYTQEEISQLITKSS